MRDKSVLEQLFTCQALVAFLAKHKPKTGELNLAAEFKWLKDTTIFFPNFWKKLGLYVRFTQFQIVGLRKSDTDSPNLHLVYVSFETARLQCTKLAREAKLADPDLYVDGFSEKVAAAFAGRRADIVTPLALAAAYVDPMLAFQDPQPEVPGGFNAISKVMKKYYQGELDPAGAAAAAVAKVLAFRERRGEFFSSAEAAALARRPNPDDFWAAAVQAEGKLGFEVCRFLENAYAGQGCAERMNKRIKSVRSANQVRQFHMVTEAYVEIGMGLQSATGPPTKTYLQYRKEQFDELRSLKAEDDAIAAADAAPFAAPAAAAAAMDEEEEEEEEDIDDVDAIFAELDAEGVVLGHEDGDGGAEGAAEVALDE